MRRAALTLLSLFLCGLVACRSSWRAVDPTPHDDATVTALDRTVATLNAQRVRVGCEAVGAPFAENKARIEARYPGRFLFVLRADAATTVDEVTSAAQAGAVGMVGDGVPADVAQKAHALGWTALPTATSAETVWAAALAQLPSPRALTNLAPRPVDASTSAAVDHWPSVAPGIFSRSFSSYDRSGGNDDGFRGTWSALYDRPGASANESVIFDAVGPGALRTLWFAGMGDFAAGGDVPLDLGRVRFYFDDERAPRIDLDSNELFDGTHAPFWAPLVAGPHVSTGGYVSWSDLTYKYRLIVTTEHRARFYQAFYDTYGADAQVASWTPGQVDSGLMAKMSGAGFSSLPLTTVPLDWSATGAGELDVVRVTPRHAPSQEELRTARVRIAFDGASQPQIDAPLGLFFGLGLTLVPLRTAAWAVDGTKLEMHLRMPYEKGVRVTITGLDGSLAVHTAPPTGERADLATLYTVYSAAHPTVEGRDFVYADLDGAGKLVATVLTVEPLAPEAKQWWEGDMRTYLDGSATPNLQGTGHEDDHLGGWSNTFFEGPFALYFHGEPAVQLIDHRTTVPQFNAHVSLYRFFPNLTFLNGLHHSTEHGRHNDRDANYTALTFVYRQARARLTVTDALIVDDDDSAQRHAYHAKFTASPLTSGFDGIPRQPVTAVNHAYAGEVAFDLQIERQNKGVYLRRLFDQMEGQSEARVEVDGVSVGSWYIAESNPIRRWAERDYYLPAQLTAGKSQLHIRLYPSHAFGAARFSALTVLP